MTRFEAGDEEYEVEVTPTDEDDLVTFSVFNLATGHIIWSETFLTIDDGWEAVESWRDQLDYIQN